MLRQLCHVSKRQCDGDKIIHPADFRGYRVRNNCNSYFLRAATSCGFFIATKIISDTRINTAPQKTTIFRETQVDQCIGFTAIYLFVFSLFVINCIYNELLLLFYTIYLTLHHCKQMQTWISKTGRLLHR